MSLILKVPTDAPVEEAVVTVAGDQYTLTPGIAKWFPPERQAAIKAAFQNLRGTMAPPSAPTMTQQGLPGVTTYSYEVAAVGLGGDTPPSPPGSIATGNAALSGSNYNQVTRAALPPHATGWRVIRSAGGSSQGDISGVLPLSQTTLMDTGQAAVPYVPAVTNPPINVVVNGPPEV